MTSNSDRNFRPTSLIDRVNKTADTLLDLENDSASDKGSDNPKLSRSSWDSQIDTQLPLLPRSIWQDRRAFLKVLIEAKRSLDIAEINAYLD